MFEIFNRLSTKRDGSGIGLALIRRIADQYGGRAWVDSAPGEGCTFSVHIPDTPRESRPEGEQLSVSRQMQIGD